MTIIMKQADIRFTYHDYLQLPDDKRYELVEGELYLVPSPNLDHQRISRERPTWSWKSSPPKQDRRSARLD